MSIVTTNNEKCSSFIETNKSHLNDANQKSIRQYTSKRKTTRSGEAIDVGKQKVEEVQQRHKSSESCVINYEVQYPKAKKMNEIEMTKDYDDSATASLQQEMNLARRACWSNNKNNNSKDNDNYIDDGENTEDDRGHLKSMIRTSVLYGATINNNNKDQNVANLNVDCKMEMRNHNDNDNDDDDDDNNDEGDAVKVECNLSAYTTTTTTTTKLNKRKVIVNTKTETEAKTSMDESKTKTLADITSTSSSAEPYNVFRELGRDVCGDLQQVWLQFISFCDSITIRHDDPRITRIRMAQTTKTQSTAQPPSTSTSTPPPPPSTSRKQSESMGASAEADANTTNASKQTTPPGSRQYKLLTNKKLIFLMVVCVIFSCVNRIEGRPNMSFLGNLIMGANSDSAAAPSSAQVLTRNDGGTGGGGGGPIATQAGDSATMTKVTDPPLSQPHDKMMLHEFPVDTRDEPHEVHDRYPLSQVDFDRVKTPFIIGIWILSASIAKIGFHMTPKLHLIFPESCLLIVVGVVIGVVLYFCTDVAVSPLTPNTFFFYMLPPIILDAGYFMPNRLFFDNLGTILLMAVVGTIFNISTIGGSLWACGKCGIFGAESDTPRLLDIFLFASLISAVDPVAVLAVFEEIHVNEILYIVVFGESLLNDAVTVVMYHMMEVYNEIGIKDIIAQDIASGVGSFFVVAVGGTAIGIIWGFLTGLVTRFTDHVRVIEPIFIFVMAYLAYLNAEIFHMSGILAITFCGITMKNYVESNISQKSHTTVKYALKMLSSSSETIIFMFLGVATVNNSHVWNTWFVILTILFCSVFRVIGVIILSALANRFRLHKLSRVDQFVMSYGGLRGAVAFALVLLVDERVVKQKNMFVTTTIAVIYFTVFLQGITIKPLVKILNVKRANKRKPTMNERIHERFMDHLMAGIEDIVGKTGNYNVRDKFKRFDNRFIRPLLIRDLKGAEPKIIETYSKLTMRDAMEVMRRNPSTIGQMTGTESMSALFRNYTNNYIGGRWAPPTIYTTCPSLTNLDNSCSRNLDMHELDYNPSKKDLTDAKIHHLLAEELKPYRRHRRLSYSRHAVDDRDLSTQVNYKMQMNFRRMFNDRKHHKRSKRGTNNKQQQEGVKQNHVSFHDFQQNGTTKQLSNDYINEVLNESAEESAATIQQKAANEISVVADDWDDGLTFTAKSSPDSDRANNNSLIAHIQNLPGFDASKARIVQHYAPKVTDTDISSPEYLLTPDPPCAPTAAELILPWRRDRSYQSIVAVNPIPEEDRNMSRDSDGERRVATPTATESQLPWKRQGDEISDAVQQNEFPAWASNKEYLAYNSPSATFLGGINKPKQPKSVIGLFRRESSGSKGGISNNSAIDMLGDAASARGSDPALAAVLATMAYNVPTAATTSNLSGNAGSIAIVAPHNPRLDKRSQSISASSAAAHILGTEAHSGPFPVTASHRRNVRRGSMLELSGDTIPEESYHPHGHSKSLCEPAGDDWDTEATPLASNKTKSEKVMRSGGIGGGGREPLLPKLTPRAQIRRMGAGAVGGVAVGIPGNKNQVTTALLSTSNSDFDDEEDEEEEEDDDEDEDFDLYDDENIVVTTLTTVVPPTQSATATPRAQHRNLSSTSSAASLNNALAPAPAPAPAPGTITTTTTSIRLTRNNDESII